MVDDGEMGKATWITYLYERVSGLEPRMVPIEGATILPPSRDRQAFPEFYAEHDAAVRGRSEMADGDSSMELAGRRDEAQVKLWFCTGPLEYDTAALEHDIARFKAALDGRRGRRCVPAGGRAGERLLAPQRALPERGGVRLRGRRRPARGVQGDRRRRPACSRSTTPCSCTSTTRSSRSAARSRTTGAGPSSASRRSSTRCAGCPRTASATTSASAAGTGRTSTTRRSSI